jgi:GT2 family glycosyltransferase
MSALAMRPDIGAVGAKLLYPDGRLQHGGLALGVGGRAAHYERLLEADDPGYFGRLGVAHEVSAVTGACLAVEARKFHAVGGFDAENLPVDLSDVDLCLRLAERGWRCVMAPEATLLHRESASRGEGGGSRRYGAEIAWFRRRWAHQIGDDPYFHPSLSLDATHPALD